MQAGGPLDFLPLWGVFLATVALILLAIEGGFRLGTYRRRRSEGEDKPPVGEMVAATLALLAFILAFTFGLAGSWFDMRRRLVVERGQCDRDDLPPRGDAPRAPPVGRPEPSPGVRERPAGGHPAGQAR